MTAQSSTMRQIFREEQLVKAIESIEGSICLFRDLKKKTCFIVCYCAFRI